MVTLLTIVHITVCLFLILVVLLQAGKGGGMGIAFGGAGSQTVFGSSGAGNFLTRLTSITAALFLVTSLALAHYSSRQDSKRLQDLASQRATEKKAEEEKAAKVKAELDKTRPATGAPASAAEGAAGSPAAAAPVAPPAPPEVTIPVKVDPKQLRVNPRVLPDAAKAPGTATVPKATATPEGAPGAATGLAAPVKRPARVKPVAPKAAAPAGDEAAAPAPTPVPAAPAAPAE